MLSFELVEQALQAPTMEAVIALSERVQTLEANPDGMVFTMLREIDNTLAIGYSDQLQPCLESYEQRGFRMVESRRGTRREHKLLLLTLEDMGLQSSAGPDYFDADSRMIHQLNRLGWPIADLAGERQRKRFSARPDHLIEGS